ncbi:MAG: hypothetical protein IKA29_01800 [Clostridia bacterium]|nr:hypothetical protein [Clostridia bacterium]
MFNSIKSKRDVEIFLDSTNSLHDGYVIGVQYSNNGISAIENGYQFDPEQTKLAIRILVTSIWDTVVELEFENLLEWQIRDNQFEITDTAIVFNEQGWIVWTDDVYINMDELKKNSYVIAKSMRWRVVE